MLEEISTTNESELFTPVQRLEEEECSVPTIDLSMPFQATLLMGYSSVGICSFIGNLLVLIVVLSKKELRNVTNLYISSVSAADLLITAISLWATPLAFYQQVWKFGQFMCYGVSALQGASLMWSPLTLAAIAVDRYKLVSSPFNPQINTKTCLAIIVAIWAGAMLMLMPALAHVHYFPVSKCYQYCVEIWPEERYLRLLYGLSVLIIRSVIPLVIISFCHYRIACILNEQTKRVNNYRSQTSIRHAIDINRKQRLQTLLLVMVIIFAVTSIPLDIFNVLQDIETVFHIKYASQHLKGYIFLLTHWVAMAGTLLNPLVYAWWNESINKEIRTKILDCGSVGRKSTSFNSYASSTGKTSLFFSVKEGRSVAVKANHYVAAIEDWHVGDSQL